MLLLVCDIYRLKFCDPNHHLILSQQSTKAKSVCRWGSTEMWEDNAGEGDNYSKGYCCPEVK